MLYVSRLIGRDKVEITDTDDNVAEVYAKGGLADILASGIKIEGADRHWDGGRGRYTVSFRPHGLSPVSTRTEMLFGIRFNVTDGVLVSVEVKDSTQADSRSIRLSKICRAVADNAFRDFKYDGKLTITADNVKSSGASFKCAHPNLGVVFDLREADDRLAWNVYRHRLEAWYRNILTEVLTDNEERFHAFIYEYVCRYGHLPEPDSHLQELLAMAVSLPGSEQMFLNKHKKKFRKLHAAFAEGIKIDSACDAARNFRNNLSPETAEGMMEGALGGMKIILALFSPPSMPDNLDGKALSDAVGRVLIDGSRWRILDNLLRITNMRNNKGIDLLRRYIIRMGGSDSDCLFWFMDMHKAAYEFVKRHWRGIYNN